MGKRKNKSKSSSGRNVEEQNSRKKEPKIVDSVDSDDDEEIDEDEAFNSDDERKYGAFFEANDEYDEGDDDDDDDIDDDDDEDGGDSDDDDEGDGGQYMLDLLNSMDEKKPSTQSASSSKLMTVPHVQESEFSVTTTTTATAGGGAGKNLTLDNLMEGIQDTEGFGNLQHTLRSMKKSNQTTSAPVAKIVSDRAQRKVHYEIQSKEVSKFIDAVQQNRKAETLDFRPKPIQESRDVMVEKFVPTTEYEKQIHAALEEAGQQDEETILKKEEETLRDDLGSNIISIEEYKKRRGELAKLRALMFYHEQKRHHINKIKSKKYRKIRKRQREKQKEDAAINDEELIRELEEKGEIERMKERATLAHKNTSKWAKRILKRGKNVDVDTRRALSAQLKRGDDLLKKMNTTSNNDDDDDSDNEDLIETAKKVLADTENNNKDDPQMNTGLFKLSFMQRGVERQRQKAKEEARQLLMELEDDEEQDQNEDKEEEEDNIEKKKKKIKQASKTEMKSILKDGELVASTLKSGTGTNVTATMDSINIDGFQSSNNSVKEKDTTISEHTTTLDVTTTVKEGSNTNNDEKYVTKKTSVKAKAVEIKNKVLDEEENPWLSSVNIEDSKKTSTSSDTPSKSKKRSHNSRGYVDVDQAVALLDDSKDRPTDNVDQHHSKETSDEPEEVVEKKITMLTQEELVRRAFASASEKELDEEFAKEKARVEEDEDPIRKKQKNEKDMTASSGWGSWTGLGAPPPPSKARKLPKKLQPPPVMEQVRKRVDAKKPHVLLSQKRLKNTANKYMIAQVPYPYSSREEYERSMEGGIGPEWNVTSSFKEMTRPEIITRSGKIIKPLSNKVKQKRAPAKF